MGKQNNKVLAQLVLLVVSTMVGIAAYVLIQRMGTHLVVNDAPLWGVATGVFVYLSQFLMLSGPLRQARGLTYGMRLAVILLCMLSMSGAAILGTLEVRRGYPTFSLSMLSDIESIDGRHFSVEGNLNKARAYKMSGNLGQFYLVPVSDFEHRILMMLPAIPTAKRVRATGKLRTDIRTVQRSKAGAVEGPFLQVYREDMQLEDNAKILFLDTSSRVGLNFLIVLWFLSSFYLFVYFVRAVPAPLNRSKMRVRSV